MNESIRAAMAQMPVTDDKPANLRTAADYVRRCADDGAQVVLLPEMFCCPYESGAFVRFGERADGPVCAALSEMAVNNRVVLIGGSFPEYDGGRLYNTCPIFDQRGNLLAKHRKVFLFDIDVPGGQYFRESDTFSPGDRATVVETDFGRIGAAVCFDIRFPELSRRMVLSGADLLAFPAAFNNTTGPAHWALHVRGRAVDNQVYVLACAPAADPAASYVSYGNSMASDPWGNILGRLGDEEGILTVTIDYERLRSIRQQLPLLSSLRTDL